MVKLAFFIFLTFSIVTFAQSLEHPTGPLGPVSSSIHIRVLDSFNQSYPHGKLVKAIAHDFLVDNKNQFPNYVYFSEENVVDAADYDTLMSLAKAGFNLPAIEQEIAIADFLIALERAGEQGVKIVNYSLSDMTESGGNQFEFYKITSILEKYDMILVVPSGNEGSKVTHYPCGYDHPQIICVAAGIAQTGVLLGDGILYSSYSNINDSVDFVASGDLFDDERGTSFAAPRITSSLGFLWGNRPYLKSREVIKELQSYGKFIDTVKLTKEYNKRNGTIYVTR